MPHAHLHIIPRLVDDAVSFSAAKKRYEGDALAEIAAKIQERLAKNAAQ